MTASKSESRKKVSPGYSYIYHLDTGRTEKFPPAAATEAATKWARLRLQGKKVRLVSGLKGK